MTHTSDHTRSAPAASTLLASDAVRLGTVGLRSRPMRAFLSALGIAIGIAAMVAVIGISTSSRAQLTRQLDALGTNLLTVTAGSDMTGAAATLPPDAAAKVALLPGVTDATSTAALTDIKVYRSSLIPAEETGGIATVSTDLTLLDVVAGEVAHGTWLNEALAQYPTTVLGASAAQRLGIVTPGTQIWMGNQLVMVAGILKPVPLAPELDSAALISRTVAQRLYGHDDHPTTVYERSADDQVARIRDLLAPTISPQASGGIKVSRPSEALSAKAAADHAFTTLLAGVGSIALLVGGIGVANTMIISVLERRQEIGLRRAMGATRAHIRIQFLSEALLLAGIGGALGCIIGTLITAVVATVSGWLFVMPLYVVAAGLAVTVVIGAVAGLYPAVRAARTPPTAALNSQ